MRFFQWASYVTEAAKETKFGTKAFILLNILWTIQLNSMHTCSIV